jgi:hypothetical protein
MGMATHVATPGGFGFTLFYTRRADYRMWRIASHQEFAGGHRDFLLDFFLQ